MIDFIPPVLGIVLFLLLLYAVRVRWTGTAARVVLCRWCVGMYGYKLTRTVTAFGWAPFLFGRERATRRAKLTAIRRVRRRLVAEPESVPCPVCGRFQPDAYETVRWTRYGWLRGTEALALVGSISLPVFIFAGLVRLAVVSTDFDPDTPTGASALGALFVLSFPLAAVPWLAVRAVRKFLQQRFEPNRDIPEAERFALARERAVVADPDPAP